VAFARCERDRDLVLREVLHDLTQCGHAREVDVGDRDGVDDDVFGVGEFANCSCISRRKMPALAKNSSSPNSTARMWSTRSTPSSSSGSQLVVPVRDPLNHPRTRRSPRLIEDRQSHRDPETLLDTDEDHARAETSAKANSNRLDARILRNWPI